MNIDFSRISVRDDASFQSYMRETEQSWSIGDSYILGQSEN